MIKSYIKNKIRSVMANETEQISKLTAVTESQSVRINELENHLSILCNQAEDLQNRIFTLEENIRELNIFAEDSASFKERIITLEENTRELNKFVEDSASFKERIITLEENTRELNKFAEDSASFKERIITLEENIRGLNIFADDSASFKERINTLEENIRGLNIFADDSASFKERINTLEENIRELNRFTDDSASFKERINTLEENTRELNRFVGDSAAFKERIGILEEKVIKSSDVYSNIDYLDFENNFRGTRESVMDIQKQYIKYFVGKTNIIDLGCGRGEFTELMFREGIRVTGVDIYQPYVDLCKSLNLPVIQCEATDFLRGVQEPAGGIFAGQIIEHLSIDALIKMLELAYEKMEEGAYIVLETPNPTCLAIFSHSFYIDPSHQKPIHPLTLQYLLRKIGFRDIEILYSEKTRLPVKTPQLDSIDKYNVEEFNEDLVNIFSLLFSCQDYAVAAKK